MPLVLAYVTGIEVCVLKTDILAYCRGKFPFESYLSYTNLAFTMKEVKHLWRSNDCMGKYGRRLNVRTDDFEKPTGTNALCSNWRTWKQPIIW